MTLDEFFIGVCQKLGFEPTPWRLDVFDYWAFQESMPFELTWNPLATTQYDNLNTNYNNGNGPGNWNSVPVRVYLDAETGIRATVNTLQNGYYPNILRCFADQQGYREAVGPRDFVSWVGEVSYGQRVVDHMNASTLSKTMGNTMTEEQILALVNARIDAALAYQFPLLLQAAFNNGFTDEAAKRAINNAIVGIQNMLGDLPPPVNV